MSSEVLRHVLRLKPIPISSPFWPGGGSIFPEGGKILPDGEAISWDSGTRV